MIEKMKINNLEVYYDNFNALKNICMSIYKNQVTALIGPSGGGKSTFLRTLNRLNDSIKGSIIYGDVFLDGENIYQRSNIILQKQVGMIFQCPNLLPVSVYDNIIYWARKYGIKKRRRLNEIVERSLYDACVWDFVKDKLRTPALNLPIEEQQFLSIARVLTTEPEVVLFDEPICTFNSSISERFEYLINNLKRKCSIVIATRNINTAVMLSDYTSFFLAGEHIEYNSTQEFFSKPKDKRTEDYIIGRLNKYF
jgi:phosphate transport system ATP-binding protein